mmetsp:Transcript_36442/g.82359  ORF Transcript_36442/g.82359 Transcript_36442/m.82359 type:complete len:240 (+) Transcript_36442:757-1476(+)
MVEGGRLLDRGDLHVEELDAKRQHLVVQGPDQDVRLLAPERNDAPVVLLSDEHADALVHGPAQELVEVRDAQLEDKLLGVDDLEDDDDVDVDAHVVARRAGPDRSVVRAGLLGHHVRNAVEGREQVQPRLGQADVLPVLLHQAVDPGRHLHHYGPGRACRGDEHQGDVPVPALRGQDRHGVLHDVVAVDLDHPRMNGHPALEDQGAAPVCHKCQGMASRRRARRKPNDGPAADRKGSTR